jgi:hypothetical protein
VTRRRRLLRDQQRVLRKLVKRTESLAAKLAGGSPQLPIDVRSASVVETKARSTPCIQCGGDLDLRNDSATSTERGILRELTLVCRRCHAPRTLWYRIAPTATN